MARFGDNPISGVADDQLDRRLAVDALGEVIRHPDLETPMTLGIFGEWGSGKTSVMRMLQAGLAAPHVTVWIDAWRYGRQAEALWRSVLLGIVNELRKGVMAAGTKDPAVEMALETLEVTLYRSRELSVPGERRVSWSNAAGLVLQVLVAGASGGASLPAYFASLFSSDKPSVKDVLSLVEREEAKVFQAQIEALEQFHYTLASVIRDYVIADRHDRRLVIFIDDLDRCLPEDALAVLEALKLFIDVPGCVFVLGMDRRVVELGLWTRYHRTEQSDLIDATQYLHKIIQVPFVLPPLSQKQIDQLIVQWSDAHGQGALAAICKPFVLAGVGPNPRQVKRTLNVVHLISALRPSLARADVVEPTGQEREEYQRVCKLVILQTSYDKMYAQAIADPAYLKRLEAQAVSDGEAPPVELVTYPRVAAMLRLGAHFAVLNDDALAELLYLTKVTAPAV